MKKSQFIFILKFGALIVAVIVVSFSLMWLDDKVQQMTPPAVEPGTMIEVEPEQVDIVRYGIVKEISYYDKKLHGKKTANKEELDIFSYTCASWDLDFNTLVIFEHKGRKVMCRVNDRGPHPDLYAAGREFDLTPEAFWHLADEEDIKKGLLYNVEVSQIVPETINR